MSQLVILTLFHKLARTSCPCFAFCNSVCPKSLLFSRPQGRAQVTALIPSQAPRPKWHRLLGQLPPSSVREAWSPASLLPLNPGAQPTVEAQAPGGSRSRTLVLWGKCFHPLSWDRQLPRRAQCPLRAQFCSLPGGCHFSVTFASGTEALVLRLHRAAAAQVPAAVRDSLSSQQKSPVFSSPRAGGLGFVGQRHTDWPGGTHLPARSSRCVPLWEHFPFGNSGPQASERSCQVPRPIVCHVFRSAARLY